MPEEIEITTLEEAIFQVVEILEHMPEEDKPEPWSVFLAIAEAYGPDTDLSFPVKCGGGGPDA